MNKFMIVLSLVLSISTSLDSQAREDFLRFSPAAQKIVDRDECAVAAADAVAGWTIHQAMENGVDWPEWLDIVAIRVVEHDVAYEVDTDGMSFSIRTDFKHVKGRLECVAGDAVPLE